MSEITENLKEIQEEVPAGIKIIAVSKTKPVASVMEAYEGGHKVFGENKAREMQKKHEELPDDIEWHMIGHLQRNKVKYIIDHVDLIHSVDSMRLLKEINKRANKANRIVDCLLQFHIAEEASKFGLSLEKAEDLLESEVFRAMDNIRITGVMGMSTYTDDEDKVKKEFKKLKSIFESLKEKYFPHNGEFREISMGMSNDYKIAVKEGATMIRVGRTIFGEREYQKKSTDAE